MSNLIRVLLVLLALALVAIVSSFLFLGVGYVVSTILPLSLFESAVLTIGSSFILAFSIAAVTIGTQISRHGLFIPREDLQEELDEDDEEKYDEYESENLLNPQRVAENMVKIGRNAPCPCGSGLKYKRCCGK
jgi:hypothetical protein